MLETRLQIRRRSDGSELPEIADEFLRRSYDEEVAFTAFPLVAGVKTDIECRMTDLQYIYIKVTGSAATIQLHQGLSPESWSFGTEILLVGLSGVTGISLEASVATTVYIYLAGT